MSATETNRSRGQKEACAQGWLVSVLLHSTVALAAILTVKQTELAPQDEAFRWNVSMVSLTQHAQSTASTQNQASARSVPSKTSTPALPAQQSAPAQTLPAAQPLAQQTTPSISEQAVIPAVTEPPLPAQPTAPSQSTAHTTQPAEPNRHEFVAPTIAQATSIVKPVEAPMAVSAESAPRQCHRTHRLQSSDTLYSLTRPQHRWHPSRRHSRMRRLSSTTAGSLKRYYAV